MTEEFLVMHVVIGILVLIIVGIAAVFAYNHWKKQ